MSFQDKLKRQLNRNNVKYIILYAFLAFLCCSGALSGLLNDNRVDLLSIIQISTRITGTIFLFLFVVMLIVLLRTVGSALSHKAYNELCDSIKKFGNPEKVLTYIGDLPKNSLCIHGELRFDEKYFFFLLDDICIVRPMREVCWGYLESEMEALKAASKKGHSLQLPSSPSPVVDILLEDNQVVNLRASNVEKADKLLEEIKKVNPEMSVGYNEKTVVMYKNNPRNMRSIHNIPEGDKDN